MWLCEVRKNLSIEVVAIRWNPMAIVDKSVMCIKVWWLYLEARRLVIWICGLV